MAHLCRGVRPPQRVSRYDTKQCYGEAPVKLENTFIAIAPRSILLRSGNAWQGPMGQI